MRFPNNESANHPRIMINNEGGGGGDFTRKYSFLRFVVRKQTSASFKYSPAKTKWMFNHAFVLDIYLYVIRAVARALIWGGGGFVYSYIRVMPDEFLLKSVVFKLISKETSRAAHKYMNIHPPPPPN